MARTLPFVTESYFGYIDPSGAAAYAQTYKGRVVIDSNGWIIHDLAGKEWTMGTPGSSSAQIVRASAYPRALASRRFVLRSDQIALGELDAQGQLLWEREFPMIITAFDAAEGRVAVGALDGTLWILDSEGKGLACIVPVVQGPIYGCALDKSAGILLVVRGIPQKVEIYRREGQGYRNVTSLQMSTSMPLQVSMAIAEDASHALVARGSELWYIGIRDGIANNIPIEQGYSCHVSGRVGSNMIAILARPGEPGRASRVMLFRNGSRVAVYENAESVVAAGDVVAIAGASGIQLIREVRP